MDQLQSRAVPPSGQLYRAPLVAVAIPLAAGIAAGRHVPLSTGFWAVLAGGALLAALAALRRKHLHLLTCGLVVAATLGIGAVHARLAYFNFAEDHVVTHTGRAGILATLRGRIVTWPKTYDAGAGVGYGYRRGPRTFMVLEAGGIRTPEGWRPVSGLVRVTVKEPDPRLRAGQQVELLGRLGRIRGPSNPGQFDWAEAGRKSHTLAGFVVEGTDGVTIRSGRERTWFREAAWRLRASARQHLVLSGDDQASRLLQALLIGERHPALRTLNRAMVRSGVAHFLSISGLHLGVFLGFVFFLCRLVQLSPRRAAITVLVILAAYMLLAEPRVFFLRSALMAASLCAGIIFGR